jgi:hypothetical protein
MASLIYSKILPDYTDLDNKSGKCPGYRTYIRENDGGVGFELVLADDKPVPTSFGPAVFMNVDEAKEFLVALDEAIKRAEMKDSIQPARGRNC